MTTKPRALTLEEFTDTLISLPKKVYINTGRGVEMRGYIESMMYRQRPRPYDGLWQFGFKDDLGLVYLVVDHRATFVIEEEE